MADHTPDIIILNDRIATDDLETLVDRFFEDMVKFVVDVERGVAAVGGELQADAEALLLEDPGMRDRLRDLTFHLIGRERPCLDPARRADRGTLVAIRSGSSGPDDRERNEPNFPPPGR